MSLCIQENNNIQQYGSNVQKRMRIGKTHKIFANLNTKLVASHVGLVCGDGT